MKIVVVSDNHGDREIIQKIVDHYEGKVDGIFIVVIRSLNRGSVDLKAPPGGRKYGL